MRDREFLVMGLGILRLRWKGGGIVGAGDVVGVEDDIHSEVV